MINTDIKIKTNDDLFFRWKQLGFNISTLNSIVQNDMIISQDQYQENKDLWAKCQEEFDDLKACTQLWIEYGNKTPPGLGQYKLQKISLGRELWGDK